MQRPLEPLHVRALRERGQALDDPADAGAHHGVGDEPLFGPVQGEGGVIIHIASIGGGDMPTVIALLNSYAGMACAADMAKAGMEGFQQFLVQPDQLEAILERLEQTRLRLYPQ